MTDWRSRYAAWLGLTGLYGFCFSTGWAVAGVNISWGLITVAALLLADEFWRDVRGLPLFWLMAVLTAYVVVQSLILVQRYPILSEASNPHWSHVARVTGLASLPIAWWLMRCRRHIPALLTVAVAGVMVGLLRESQWSQMLAHGLANRDYWGETPQKAGYLWGLILTGAAVYTGSRFLHGDLTSRRCQRQIAGGAIMTAIATVPVLYSQTRGAWLGCAGTVGGYLLINAAVLLRRRERLGRLAASAATVVVITGGVLAFAPGNMVSQRLGSVERALNAAETGRLAPVIQADGSVGKRLLMWKVGLEAWTVKPVFGWGVGGKPLVQQWSGEPIGKDGHFHDLYVDLLVGLGSVGFILFGLVIVSLVMTVAHNRPTREPAVTIHTLTLGLLTFSGIYYLVELSIGHTRPRAALMFILALMLATVLQQAKSPAHPAPPG